MQKEFKCQGFVKHLPIHSEDFVRYKINLSTFSLKDYVVVFIDGRGSGHQGWRVKQPLYGNFGTVEVDDQVETMRLASGQTHRYLSE